MQEVSDSNNKPQFQQNTSAGGAFVQWTPPFRPPFPVTAPPPVPTHCSYLLLLTNFRWWINLGSKWIGEQDMASQWKRGFTETSHHNLALGMM